MTRLVDLARRGRAGGGRIRLRLERAREQALTQAVKLGGRAERADRLRTAIACHRTVLALTTARQQRYLPARDHVNRGLELTYRNLAIARLRSGHPQKAIGPLRRALSLCRLNAFEGIESPIEELELVRLLGAACEESSRPAEASRYYKVALWITQADGDKEGELEVLASLAVAQAECAEDLSSQDWREAAIRTFVAQLELARELGDEGRRAEALANGSLALMKSGKRGDEVVEFLAEGVEVWRDFRRGEEPGTHNLTKILIRQGRCFIDRGEPAAALAPLRTAVEEAQTLDCRCRLNSIRYLCQALDELGDHVAGERYLTKAIAHCRQTGSSEEVEFLYRLGRNLADKGDLPNGLEVMEDAVARAEELARTDPAHERLVGLALSNQGAVLNDVFKRFGAAAAAIERALEIACRRGDDYGRAVRLGNLGVALKNKGDPESLERSLSLLREALEAHRDLDEPEIEANVNRTLALAHLNRNEVEEGVRRFEVAAESYKERGRAKALGQALLDIAEAPNLSPGSRAGYLARAAEVAVGTGNPAVEAQAMRELARVRRAVGMETEAAELHQRGIEIVESARARLDSKVERAQLLETHSALYADAASLAHRRHQPRSAFQLAEAGRARLALDQRAEVAAEVVSDPELRRRRRDLATKIGDCARRLERLGIERLRAEGHEDVEGTGGEPMAEVTAEMGRLEREWEQLDAAVGADSPRLAARIRAGIDSIWTVPKIQEKILDDNCVLLEYLVADDVCLLFAITDERFEVFEIDLDSPTLTKMVTEMCTALEAVDPGYPHGHALYKALVEPAAGLVDGREEVLICPDGILHRLPFAALLREDPMAGATDREPRFAHLWPSLSYFLDSSIHIRYIASATTEGMLRQAEAAEGISFNGELLAFGAPLASVDAAIAERFPPLRFALGELGTIAGSFRSSDVVSRPCSEDDSPVTKAGVLELLDQRPEGFRFVHFATHALADDQAPWLSALLFEPEAGDGGMPGYLHANEAIDLRLPAECVTMSGCHTLGANTLTGEGIVGLAVAFRHAGARNVCASLWEVADETTADLMGYFYAALQEEGRSPAAALAEAQRRLMAQGDHPRHWAAFGVFG